jgi:putative OPT family oligopeptide transporter
MRRQRGRRHAPPPPPPPPAKRSYLPDVHADWNVAEFSFKSVPTGILLGIVFGAANAYIGLKAGVTVSASIPVAVASVAVFSALRVFGVRRATMLETNLSQSIGSAGESLASGVIFTIPALILWGLKPEWWTISLYAGLGGVLGVLFMVPLRRFLIVDEHGKLTYPEGTACAEVIRAADRGGQQARYVFSGLGVAAGYHVLMAGLGLWKSTVQYALPGVRNTIVSCSLSPAYLGVGYILGFRIASIMVGGGLISWLVLIPLIGKFGAGLETPTFPETSVLIRDMSPVQIWNRYIRYIGAGAVAFGGVLTLIRSLPVIAASFRAGLGGMTSVSRAALERTDRDMDLKTVLVGAGLITAVCAFTPWVPLGILGAILMVIFAFFFVTVSSRIVGLVGTTSNPISGMTIATLLGTSMLFLLLGRGGEPNAKVSVLLIGALVAMASAVAGDTSQDLKTGFLIGATPWKQQVGELIGVVTSMVFIGFTILFLHNAYTIGSADLSAPQATLMQLVVDGVLDRNLPWELGFVGTRIGAVLELFRIPSLPMAVGLYLPLATTMPIFIGGAVRVLATRMAKTHEKAAEERGILLGSGMVGGEGIIGVIIALLLNEKTRDFVENTLQTMGRQWWIPLGAWGDTLSLLVFAALILFLIRQSVGTLRT